MSKQTKIVATVSDRRCEVSFIRDLYENGMNVVRMNSAHLNEDGFKKIITNVREVSSHIAILMDTKGPEIRTTTIDNEGTIVFETGAEVYVMGDPAVPTTAECICVNYPNFVRDINIGDLILIDDGELEFLVVAKDDEKLTCRAQNNGELGARKSVNVPGVRISLPSLTERDKTNIMYAIEHEVEFIAHSFVRTKQDVLDIQTILDAHDSAIKIIAKIENQEGVDNIDEILEAAYGVMIARGDLGIEIPQEKIPGIQRILIRKCVQAKKPVIVATQMLHSMIKNPRPTRAEVTDIANAIYYRTDALMLSGETAYGKYPVEAVATMAKVAEEAEKTKLQENDIRIDTNMEKMTLRSYLAKQAVKAIAKLDVKTIVTDNRSGVTTLNIAAYRGTCKVLAICHSERVMRELALSYGINAVYYCEHCSTRKSLYRGVKQLVEEGHLQPKDHVAFVGRSGNECPGTSCLEINSAERILNTYSSL